MLNNPSSPEYGDKTSRRSFIRKTVLGAGGLMILPRHVLGGPGFQSPSDKLNIAIIGAGGRGKAVLDGCTQWNKETKTWMENVVALCDVDANRAGDTFKQYPKAKQFVDFREMYDKMSKDIDGVIVATPDHTHAVAALPAMQMGKQVYVEKPLTHNLYEARVLTEAARKYKVVTQMGNQGNSSNDARRIAEWIAAGTIGQVREVHAWTNRPIWPQGLTRAKETFDIPSTLDWDKWLGPAPERPYNPLYVPFGWRGWWDFGTGALGDMACHILDPVVTSLKLGYPSSVEASAVTQFGPGWKMLENQESAPLASMIHFEFPEREGFPPLKLTWYDGGLMPQRPEELLPNEEMGDWNGGVIFVGDKGKLMCNCYAANPRLLPSSRMVDFKEPTPTLARVNGTHYTSWVEACKGNGPMPSSNFETAGKLTEIVLMGNLAIRSFYTYEDKPNANTGTTGYTGRRKLLWDGPNMKITNYDAANQFVKREYRKGWELKV